MSSNYGIDLFRQLEEALLKIDFLIDENKVLKNKVVAMEENQKKEITQLNSKITALETENQKLKDIINKNSGNSSKPPSNDAFKKIQNSCKLSIIFSIYIILIERFGYQISIMLIYCDYKVYIIRNLVISNDYI